MKRQSGFTLIELVVVIVILGILAAVAVPRFASLERDARRASLAALRGSVEAAAMMVSGAARARVGQVQPIDGCTTTAGGGGNVTLRIVGQCVNLVSFYPEATAAGIVAAAVQAPNFPATAADLLAKGYDTTGGGAGLGGAITFRMANAPTPAGCSFTYTAPAVAGAAPAISALIAAGC